MFLAAWLALLAAFAPPFSISVLSSLSSRFLGRSFVYKRLSRKKGRCQINQIVIKITQNKKKQNEQFQTKNIVYRIFFAHGVAGRTTVCRQTWPRQRKIFLCLDTVETYFWLCNQDSGELRGHFPDEAKQVLSRRAFSQVFTTRFNRVSPRRQRRKLSLIDNSHHVFDRISMIVRTRIRCFFPYADFPSLPERLQMLQRLQRLQRISSFSLYKISSVLLLPFHRPG